MKKKDLRIIITAVAIVIIGLIGIIWYTIQLKPVNKNSNEEIQVEIESGMRTSEILSLLKEKKIIRSIFASGIYMKANSIKGLQAGKYSLSSNMSLEQVLEQISSGNIIDEQIEITFLEGKNMRWVAKIISEKTNNSEQSVYELLSNKTYIQTLINKYWFLTEDIIQEEIYYPLEGYLWPETYKFESPDIEVEKIFEVLLDQTNKEISKYRNDIVSKNLSVHQVLTMASIVELEGNDVDSRKGIARVIYNRLINNMSLGSDVTTYYAIQVDVKERNLYNNEINQYNAYNTRGPNMSGKLPIGPISLISNESIEAVLNPSEGSYLYFVADSKGKIYFSNTYEEHNEIIANLQRQGLWYSYENN